MRIQDLEPVVFLEHPNDVQRVVFKRQLRDLIPNRLVGNVLDVIIFSSRLITRLRPLLQWPMKPRRKPTRPNQA